MALSAFDDMRFILENSVNTLAWEHYKIKLGKNALISHLNSQPVDP